MWTFNDLLDYPIVKSSKDVSVLTGFYHSHVFQLAYLRDCKTVFDNIDIHYIINHKFDHRRVWKLFYVTYAGEVVMVCASGGREGDDHNVQYVLNGSLFKNMIMDFINNTEYETHSERDEDISDLEIFMQNLNPWNIELKVPDEATSYNGFNLNDCFLFSNHFDG